MTLRSIGLLSVAVVFAVGCAAPAPTATPTTPPAAAVTPTPTKAPTATPTKRPVTKVTVAATSYTLSHMPALVARAKGYWLEEGLDVNWALSGGGPTSLAAVVSGDTDFSFGAFSPEVINVIDAGQPIKVVAIFQQRGVEVLALNKKIAVERGVSQKSSLADKAKALKGLTIAALSPAGGVFQLLKMVLAEGGLDPERDLTVTFISNAAAVAAAMSHEQIQGFMHTADAAALSILAGDAVVLVSASDGDVPQRGNAALIGMMTQEQTISRRPEVVDGALRAIWRGQRFLQQDYDGAGKALKTLEFFSEVSEDAIKMTMQLLRGAMTETPILTAEQFNDLVKFHNLSAKADQQTKITKGQLFDDGPALRAKKQLGF